MFVAAFESLIEHADVTVSDVKFIVPLDQEPLAVNRVFHPDPYEVVPQKLVLLIGHQVEVDVIARAVLDGPDGAVLVQVHLFFCFQVDVQSIGVSGDDAGILALVKLTKLWVRVEFVLYFVDDARNHPFAFFQVNFKNGVFSEKDEL